MSCQETTWTSRSTWEAVTDRFLTDEVCRSSLCHETKFSMLRCSLHQSTPTFSMEKSRPTTTWSTVNTSGVSVTDHSKENRGLPSSSTNIPRPRTDIKGVGEKEDDGGFRFRRTTHMITIMDSVTRVNLIFTSMSQRLGTVHQTVERYVSTIQWRTQRWGGLGLVKGDFTLLHDIHGYESVTKHLIETHCNVDLQMKDGTDKP